MAGKFPVEQFCMLLEFMCLESEFAAIIILELLVSSRVSQEKQLSMPKRSTKYTESTALPIII